MLRPLSRCNVRRVPPATSRHIHASVLREDLAETLTKKFNKGRIGAVLRPRAPRGIVVAKCRRRGPVDPQIRTMFRVKNRGGESAQAHFAAGRILYIRIEM